MMKKIKSIVLAVAALATLSAPVLLPASAFAQIGDCTGIGDCLNKGSASTDTSGQTGDASTRVNSIIKTVINLFSLVVGVIAVIMIIIGGLKYITSGGDSGNVSGAKNTILYAVVGLVVVALAQIIVRFVIERVTSSNNGA